MQQYADSFTISPHVSPKACVISRGHCGIVGKIMRIEIMVTEPQRPISCAQSMHGDIAEKGMKEDIELYKKVKADKNESYMPLEESIKKRKTNIIL